MRRSPYFIGPLLVFAFYSNRVTQVELLLLVRDRFECIRNLLVSRPSIEDRRWSSRRALFLIEASAYFKVVYGLEISISRCIVRIAC